MPLSETEREVSLQPSVGEKLPVPDTHGPAWPGLVYLMWRQRRRIMAWVLLGMLISATYSWFGGKYEATVQLMPPDNQSSGLASLLPALSRASGGGSGLLDMAGDIAGIKTTTSLFIRVLQSRTVQDKLIDDYNLMKVYGKRRHVDARQVLAEATLIEEDKKSGVVSITVKNKDRVLAMKLAGAYVTELNRVLTRASNSSARREQDFIEKRQEEERQELAAAQQKLNEFSSANMTLNPTDQMRVTVESASRLEGELIAARAELQGLEQTYTAENTRVKTLRARIGELESAVRKINVGRGSAPADPSNPYPSVKALPGLTTQWADLYRNVKLHETVYEMLITRHEMASIQAVKDTPSAKMLDEPSLPEKSYPRPFWVMIIGTLTSVILACAGVLLKERWQTWDETDSRRILLSNMYFGARNSMNGMLNLVRGRSTAGRNAQ